jgi:hypothetical protein
VIGAVRLALPFPPLVERSKRIEAFTFLVKASIVSGILLILDTSQVSTGGGNGK